MELASKSAIVLRQRRELAELAGFETRNKFEILAADGTPIGFAAEQGRGLAAFLARSFLGHWRTFEIHVFDMARQAVLVALHPWRIFLQRLEVQTPDGRPLGALQQRFSILTKRFDLERPGGGVLMTVSSPLWRPWTFPFERCGVEVAFVRKRWSGLLQEALLDADNFRIEFTEPSLSEDERALLLAAGLFIDLQYFERKAKR
jgi:uncharacterized protein YxjI